MLQKLVILIILVTVSAQKHNEDSFGDFFDGLFEEKFGINGGYKMKDDMGGPLGHDYGGHIGYGDHRKYYHHDAHHEQTYGSHLKGHGDSELGPTVFGAVGHLGKPAYYGHDEHGSLGYVPVIYTRTGKLGGALKGLEHVEFGGPNYISPSIIGYLNQRRYFEPNSLYSHRLFNNLKSTNTDHYYK